MIEVYNKLGVKCYSFYEFSEKVEILTEESFINAAGYYFPTYDIISLNPISLTNFTVLHELIHWTGHSSRLNRLTIRTIEESGKVPKRDKDYDFEEMIANFGALTLLEYFDMITLREMEDFKWSMGQLKYKGFFSRRRAIKEAHKAVNYILSRIGDSRTT